ncbi:hypothetical protein PanWU01x14_037810 [Parasponia andersonii]|uniref:Uncharacterized protein n=1 Tax=Parasponia andersonii TaxID=3476 RepID=A0A2P5DRZ7_PARAD|nr:hypothetical protein PanWU01x14_037810 [Parasponia andersonii]
MGNESSRETLPEAKDSSLSRFKERLHLHGVRRHLHFHSHGQRGGGSGSSSSALRTKLLNAEHFAGIALLSLRRAEMKFKDKWLACVSFGEQTFRTQISDQ